MLENMEYDEVDSGMMAVKVDGQIGYYLKYWVQKLAREKVEGGPGE